MLIKMFKREQYENIETTNSIVEIKDPELRDFIIANFILSGDITNKEYFKKYDIFPDETIVKAFNDYGINAYIDINTMIRNNKINEQINFYINNLRKAMKIVRNYRLNKKFIVWRGVNPDSMSQYYSEIINLKTKQFLNNDSFLSTSYDLDSALKFSGCCLFKIYIDPSQDLEYVFMDLSEEKEFLFENGTYFEYIDEYDELFEYDGSRRKVFEVFLKKKQVIQEYGIVSTKVMDEKQFYNSVINRIPQIITEDMITEELEIFDNLEDIQNSQYIFFIKYLKMTYPENYKSLESQFKDLREVLFEYVEKIFNKSN